ncbi:MAG TPA: hypothetical protein VJ837_01355, partial [Candidatus Paceibacterota bacterium]|nr:hypothetical protein [Candidatus Paceibacterota bacterium]
KTGEKPTVGVTADKSFVVRDTADNNKQHLFKPLAAEKSSLYGDPRGIREGEQAPREVAASIAAQELGIPSAKAKLVTIDGQKGVLIEWHAKNTLEDLKVQDRAAFDRLVNSEKFKQAMRGVDALDYLIDNLDRSHNWANYLYEFTPTGELQITVIDNALTFTSTKGRADIVGSTRGLPESYSPDLVTKIRDLSKNRDEFVEKISPLVGNEAIPGVLYRLDMMLKDIEAKEPK